MASPKEPSFRVSEVSGREGSFSKPSERPFLDRPSEGLFGGFQRVFIENPLRGFRKSSERVFEAVGGFDVFTL